MSEPPKKRNRVSLSCTYCKKRKVKCDRGRPCASCVKYNAADSCHYPGFHDGQSFSETDNVSDMSRKPTFKVREGIYDGTTHPSMQVLGANGYYMPNNVLKFDKKHPIKNGHKVLSNGQSPDSSRDSPNNHSDNSVISELESLKGKIKQLEANISNGQGSNFSILESKQNSLRPPSSDGFIRSSSQFQPAESLSTNLSPSPNSPFTNGVNSVLPPITWSPAPTSDSLGTNASYNGLPFSSKCQAKYCRKNPYGSINDRISLYDPSERLIVHNANFRQNYGVFTWLSFISRDKGVRILWNRFQTAKSNPISHVLEKGKVETTETSSSLVTEEHEEEFKTRAAIFAAANDLNPIKKNNIEKRYSSDMPPLKWVDSDEVRQKKHKQAMTLGLVTDSSVDKDLELADQIVKVLPKKKIVWLLINKFFTHVYPFMPFYDETSLKSEFTRIIGPQDLVMEDFEQLNVEKRLDYAYIGLLLVMIRLTYLSLFSNIKEVNETNLTTQDTSAKAQEIKLLLSNPITIQVIDMAQLCVDKFDIYRKSTLVVLQLMQTLRLYHMFGPEEGDGADSGLSQTANSMIVQIAYQMGINREPESYDPEGDEKLNNLLRKLWFFIVINDLILGYQYGSPMTINRKYYDTRLPFYRKGNENIQDVEMEKDVLSSFGYFERYYKKIMVLLDVLLDHSRKTNVKEVTDLLTDFELFVSNSFGDIKDYTVPFKKDVFNYSFIKVMKCKNFLNLTNFIVAISMNLQIHYEQTGNWEAMCFYIKKITSISVLGLIPYYNELIGNNHVNFGEAADLILNPSLIATMHKTSLYVISVMLRVNGVIHQFKKSSTHSIDLEDTTYRVNFHRYCKLSKSMLLCLKYIIASVSRLSNRYYYAWRVSKSHNYLYRTVISNQLYDDSNFSFIVEDFKHVPMSDIDELTMMFDQTLEQINDRKNRRKSEYKGQASPTNGLNEVLDEVVPPGYEFEYSPKSNNTDNVYQNIVNNKEIDDLWANMASTFGKDDLEFWKDPTLLITEFSEDLFQPSDSYFSEGNL